MNVKNLNPLERHVEKIVLAVAVAGAVYIGYLSTQPITVPETDVKAGDVEQKVTQAVEHLQQVRAEVAKRSDLTPRLKSYVDEYTTIMSRQPLRPELVATNAIPQFAPLQESITPGDIDAPGPHDMQVVTPVVPLPKNLTATSTRATVAIVPPPAPGTDAPPPPTPGTLPPGAVVKDLNWVTISGRIPMADFIAEMNDPALQPNQKLATAVQRSVLYRVEVQRRARTNGTWSSWENIAPTKANGDPISIDWTPLSDNDVVTQVAALDNAFRKIAEPDFYTLANGQPIIPAILTKPDPTATKPAVKPLTPPPPQQPVDVDNPTPAPATPAAPGMPDLTTLRQQPNIPFWFYDENVSPNQEYQYQVRLVMFNPTYRFPSGLKDPKMKDLPTIASNWLVVPGTVTVNSDMYFFVDSGIGSAASSTATTKVGFRIFKWTNGNWYSTQGTAQPGMPVTGSVRLFDKGNALVEVPTGFTLVDVLPGTAGSELTAVLLSPTQELVTRNSKSDQASANAKRQELEKIVIKPAPPPAPAPRPRVVPPPQPSRNNPGQRPELLNTLGTHHDSTSLSRSKNPDFEKKRLRPRFAALSMCLVKLQLG